MQWGGLCYRHSDLRNMINFDQEIFLVKSNPLQEIDIGLYAHKKSLRSNGRNYALFEAKVEKVSLG